MSDGQGSCNRRLFETERISAEVCEQKERLSCECVLKESSRLEVLDIKGPFNESFHADSWDTKEFLVTRLKRLRGLINTEQR